MEFGIDSAQWRGVLAGADAGEISLHPDVGKGLDRACDDYIAELDEVLRHLDQVRTITGVGTFPSGKALAEKFSQKATGTEQSLDVVVRQHIDAVQTMKAVVAKAIANFVANDQDRADRLTGLGEP